MTDVEEDWVTIEIPTDGESDESTDNSEDELLQSDNILPESSANRTGNDDELYDGFDYESDKDDDKPLSVRLSEMDGILENKKRSHINGEFTEHVGPTKLAENLTKPGEIFLSLFSEQNIRQLVEQSNLYCQQKNISFHPITSEEIKIFLGLNIMMGIKKLPSYRDYWSANPQLKDSYISSFMPVKRFSFLLSHLHLNDSSKEPQKNDPEYDKLYKLRPFLETLSENYAAFYDGTRKRAIDESMIKFKGRSTIKQYLPMKPIKRGFKVWVQADEHGYVCKFQIYTGKLNNQTEKLLGERIVKDLSYDLRHKYYQIFFDNYFTSVNLMSCFLKDKILACGTVRKDRKDLPKVQTADKNFSHGDSEYRTSCTGVVWLKWADKKIVQFLSNNHDPSTLSKCTRKQKDGSLKELSCPIMVKDYNKYMGCVDKADMLKSCYEISRKSKKWWHRIFWHFVDVTLVNSFIIYNLLSKNNSLLLKNFRLAVADYLLQISKLPKKGRPFAKTPMNSFKPQVTNEVKTSQVSHLPVVLKKRRRCAHCSTVDKEQRTKFYCKTCQVPLCIEESSNCFDRFHQAS